MAESVFINAPFDRRYRRLFDALVFAVVDCGFEARCALEGDDGSEVRLDKIYRLIQECALGIHDLSRTTLDSRHRLPRFNMPLELGPAHPGIPAGALLARRCLQFSEDLPRMCRSAGAALNDLTFIDYRLLVRGWCAENPSSTVRNA